MRPGFLPSLSPIQARSTGTAGSDPRPGVLTIISTATANGAATMDSPPVTSFSSGVPTPSTSARRPPGPTARLPSSTRPSTTRRSTPSHKNGIKLVCRLAGFKDDGAWAPGLGSCPVRFEGDEGWVEAGDFHKIAVSDPKLLEGVEWDELPGTDPIKHVRNFLGCVHSREKTSCNSTVARYGHIAGHAAAISWKLGRKTDFNPETETFIGDDVANRMCGRARRAPWHA